MGTPPRVSMSLAISRARRLSRARTVRPLTAPFDILKSYFTLVSKMKVGLEKDNLPACLPWLDCRDLKASHSRCSGFETAGHSFSARRRRHSLVDYHGHGARATTKGVGVGNVA